MSEEIENPAISVPRSIVTSIIVNGCLGFGVLLATLFGLGNIDAVLKSPTGFPYMEIFVQATGSVKGSTAMASIIVALAICATIGFVATSSRMIWSFARDRGLPFSSLLSKVKPQPSEPRSNTSALIGAIRLSRVALFHSIPLQLPPSLRACWH